MVAMSECEVIVVGAGIVGASIAHALTRAGINKVAVIERDSPSSGSSARAAGIVTVQLWNQTDMRLVKRSIEIFEEIERGSSMPFKFNRTGMITLATRPEDIEILREWNRWLKAIGVSSTLLSHQQLVERFHDARFQDHQTGLFVENDGFLNPTEYVSAVLSTAQELGVEVKTQTNVTSLLTKGNEVVGVQTSKGAISCDAVILASGAWTRALMKTAGLDVPLRPYRTQLVTLKFGHDLKLPAVHDVDLGFYFRPETKRIVVAGDGTDLHEVDPFHFNQSADSNFLSEISAHLSNRIQGGAEAQLTSSWAGICCSTPDRRPLVGQYHKKGLLLACGMQGYGVMRGPALGEAVVSTLLDRKFMIDVHDFRAERYMGYYDFPIREGFTLQE